MNWMITEADWVHSGEEDRYVSLGLSNKNRLLVVIYTERVRTIRLISAREPTAREKHGYATQQISEIPNPALSELENDHEYNFSNGVRGSQQQKYSLNLAGEFYVAAELNRRGIFASVTYGAAKNADVLAFDQQSHQTAVIEVKTTAFPNKKMDYGPAFN